MSARPILAFWPILSSFTKESMLKLLQHLRQRYDVGPTVIYKNIQIFQIKIRF